MDHIISAVGTTTIPLEPGKEAGSPIEVYVSDAQTSQPLPNYKVGFFVQGWKAGVSPSLYNESKGAWESSIETTTTDEPLAPGHAKVRVKGGSEAKDFTIEAVIDGGAGDPHHRVEFTADVRRPVDVTALDIVSGDHQYHLTSSGIGVFAPLSVRARNGAGPVKGAIVTFEVRGAPGITVSPNPAKATDALGETQVTLQSTLPLPEAAPFTVIATCGGHSVTFTEYLLATVTVTPQATKAVIDRRAIDVPWYATVATAGGTVLPDLKAQMTANPGLLNIEPIDPSSDGLGELHVWLTSSHQSGRACTVTFTVFVDNKPFVGSTTFEIN